LLTIKPDIEPMLAIAPRPAASIGLPNGRQHQEDVEIDVDDVPPVLVGSVLGAGLASRDAGVGDESVDAALFLHDAGGAGVDFSRIGDVHLEEISRMPLAFIAACASAAWLGLRSAIDRRARLAERLDAGKANALRAAGDDCNSIDEFVPFEMHCRRPLVSSSSCRRRH
jgi:hypothetical protein